LIVFDGKPIGVMARLLLEPLRDGLACVVDFEFYKRRGRNGTLAGIH
jgi:hypothetical protein